MEKKTAVLTVTVELDPVPGTFHTLESAGEQLAALLMQTVPHYHPKVFPTTVV
jgi:hypothetical protein